jgi:hypothetical protein
MQQQSLFAFGASRWIAGACLALVCGGSGCALDVEGEGAADEEIGAEQNELGADLAGPFTVNISPPSQNVTVGDSAFYSVQVLPLEGFSGDVSLAVTSDPPWAGDLHMFFGVVSPPDSDFLDAHGDCDTAPGTYTLTVVGTGDDETTVSDTALLVVAPPRAPSASFFTDRDGFTVEFSDGSFTPFCTDIVAWAWDFGDGATSNEQNPVHTYAARGDYTVTLTVTDNQGLTDVETRVIEVLPPPPVLDIVGLSRNKSRFEFRVDLTWSGAEGELVNLLRNSVSVDVPDNDGEHRDRFRSLQTSFRWRICELAAPDFCSNEVRLDVAPNMTGEMATVSAEVGGQTIVKRLRIRDE